MLFLSNFTLVCQLKSQTKGQLKQPTIPAPSIANNILDAPSKHKIAIYLPPSYNSSTKTYPVIYFLTGFSTPVTDFINGSFQGFILQNTMDQLIQAGTIHEMIVVVVRAGTFIGGAFYVNSSVSGNWEDFIVKDVVSYVVIIIEHLPLLNPEVSQGIPWEDLEHYTLQCTIRISLDQFML
jgi:hypothetical protein